MSLKHVPMFHRDRLEKLLAFLRRRSSRVTLRDLTHRHGFRRFEVLAAMRLGWVTLEVTRFPRAGRPSHFISLKDDTSQAIAPPEEWQVPYLIVPRHREFAIRTLDLVPSVTRRGLSFHGKSLVRAYRETYPRARSYSSARSAAGKLFRRGDVQAVRVWLLAQRAGLIPPHDKIPGTVEWIDARLRAALRAHARRTGQKAAALRACLLETSRTRAFEQRLGTLQRQITTPPYSQPSSPPSAQGLQVTITVQRRRQRGILQTIARQVQARPCSLP